MISSYGHGKCLILGGYLILDKNNVGVCISLEPKIKCRIKKIFNSNEFKVNVNILPHNLKFIFNQNDWNNLHYYVYNKKFERYILSVLNVFFNSHPIPNYSIEIDIYGDDEFYCENGKTGLGSSSATTVAVMKGLFKLFNDGNDDNIFKYSAVAHSIAQGNIGSCFDIACAVWGSLKYKRPSPEFISVDKLKMDWDYSIESISLPKSIHLLILSNPFSGSSTPSLVKKFLSKSKDDPELYYKLLKNVNNAIDSLSQEDFLKIRNSFGIVRNTLVEITNKWGILVLPPQVNEIAEKVEAIDGVIASIIPGAGGFDSIAILSKYETIDLSSIGLKIIAKSLK